jgi:hypothetical protein
MSKRKVLPLALLGLLAGSTATAAPTTYTLEQQERALAGRFQQGTAPVLERLPDLPVRTVAAHFLGTLWNRPTSTFSLSPATLPRLQGSSLVYASPEARVAFAMDGTGLSYSRLAVAPDATVKALSATQIDAPARRVISERLAGIVELARDERLVLVDVQPRTFETFEPTTGNARSYVEATRATYAVEKQGLLIMSSTVSIELRRTDEIVGVEVALERYQVRSQGLVLATPDVMRQRVRTAAIDLATPAADERLTSYLCGYMSNRSTAGSTLEPVCLVQVAKADASKARFELIPMAARPAVDAAVPMTAYLAAHGEPVSREHYRKAVHAAKVAR